MTEGPRAVLENLARSRSAPHREATPTTARLVAAEGVANTTIATEVGVSPASVVTWRERLRPEGPSPFARVHAEEGRPPRIPAEKIDKGVRPTETSPRPGEAHWSCRSMADETGVSPATVPGVSSVRGLTSHLLRPFTFSNDRHFEEKLIDVVGLYVNPPEKVVVLCID